MKAFLLSAIMLAAPAALLAQASPEGSAPSPVQRHHGNPHKAALRMEHQLGLSPEQEARIEPILAARRQKVEAVRADTHLTEADRRQQLKSIHRQSRADLASVLTPEQVQQLKALHRGRHTPPAAPAGA